MLVGGHSPLPEFSREGRCWGSFPPPRKRFRAAPARLPRLSNAPSLLHSLLHPRGLRGTSRRREGKGEGRDWGERVREGEEDRKTGQRGHDVTSCWFGKGGAETPLVSAPEARVEAGLLAGRSPLASLRRFF